MDSFNGEIFLPSKNARKCIYCYRTIPGPCSITKLHNQVTRCWMYWFRSPCWLPVKFWLVYHHTIGFSLENYVIKIFHWLISWFILWLRYWFLIKSIIVQTGIEAKREIASKNVFIASILYLKMVSLSNLCRPSNSCCLGNNHPSNTKQGHG